MIVYDISQEVFSCQVYTGDLINSQENYEHYLHAGFHVIKRDESRSIEQTLEMVEKVFGLR